MRTHTHQMICPMARKPAPRAQAPRDAAQFVATLIILIALLAFAPLTGGGQTSGRSSHPGNRLQLKGSVSGSSRPGGNRSERMAVRGLQTKRHDTRVMTPGNSLSFLPAVNYNSGGWFPVSVAIADLNGDGKPDVVVANYCKSSCADIAEGGLGVLLGNGDGTFQQAVTYDSGGTTAVSVAVADLNGDGKPDLVVVNYSSNTVGVLMGNGDGTFQPVVTYGTGGGEPSWVAVADLNGDGKPDLVVANVIGSGQMGVLLGNGDGTFQPALTYGSFGYYSVAVGDLNGDGKLDLVGAHSFTAGSVGVLLGNGDGTFQNEVTYDSGGSFPRSAAIADVSGDGKLDLLVVNRRSFDVGVLLGNGDGTFQAAVSYASGAQYVDSVAVADLDGDGEPDLVLANENFSVGVLLGNGDGTFQPATTFSTASYSLGSVAAADVNGDGRPDLVVVNQCTFTCESAGLVSVLLNNTGSVQNPTTTAVTSSLNPATYGQAVTFTAHVTATSGTPTGTVMFFDGTTALGSATLANGSTSISISSLAAGAHSITAAYQGGLGFAPSTSTPLTQTVTMATSTTALASSVNPAGINWPVTYTATVTSQFGGAATGSVVFFSGSHSLGAASLNGNHATLTTSFAAVGTYSISAKYNGDGSNAGSTSSVLAQVIMTATLRFLSAVTYASGGFAPGSVVVGDMNGDGKPDLIVANGQSASVGILNGSGDGTFQTAVAYDTGGQFPASVAVGDLLTPPGQLEVVVANGCANPNTCAGSGESGVGVLFAFGNPKAVTYRSGGSVAQSVKIADVNNDGIPDLLVAHFCASANIAKCTPSTSGSVGVLIGHDDIFTLVKTYYSGGLQTAGLAVADVNGDGQPDLLVVNTCASAGSCTNGSVGVLLGNGDGTFKKAVTYPTGYFPLSIAVADVNGDGRADVLVANDCPSSGSCGNGSEGVLLGRGDGTFGSMANYDTGGMQPQSVAVADVNGDGKLDALVANSNSNTVGLLLGNGDGTFQAALTYDSGGSSPLSAVAADLNGDGKLDIVVVNADSNTVGVLLNNTTLGKSTTTTSFVSSLNPSIYGQAVTWTATVTSSGSTMPTGKVTFTWGNAIGSALLNSSGVATLTKSSLNADTFPLMAVYSGDAANLGSTSAVLNQVVKQTTSAATLTSSPNPSTQGQAVTFTATITSPTVTAKGPVTFTAGKTVLGTAQLSNGHAKLTTSSLPVGSTKVTATYYGDSDIAKSSASVTQTVQ